MDVHCRFCGEPWDRDSLHDAPAGSVFASCYDAETRQNPGYDRACTAFRQHGCGFFAHLWNQKPLADCKAARCNKSDVIGLVHDLAGDDMDFDAAVLEEVVG